MKNYRKVKPNQFHINDNGTIWFRVRIKHTFYHPVKIDGSLFQKDELLEFCIDTDVFVFPHDIENKMHDEEYNESDYNDFYNFCNNCMVSQLMSDAGKDDAAINHGTVNLLDEENVMILDFKTSLPV
ncbi:MAG: hypothetical protein ACRC2T_14845 [Thermoguttaceae bacterium]